jgi:hypothetical protein
MPIPVWTFVGSYPVTHQLDHEFIQNDFGDGYVQIISHEAAYSRSGGTGAVASYRGLNRFTIKFNKAKKGELADQIWLFMRDRLDNMNEPFYFYNPSERLTPDPTGADPIGRYLVRFADPKAVMNREFASWCMFSYNGITFVEDRG